MSMGTTFVRVGPKGIAIGAFEDRDDAIGWLIANHGVDEAHEGATFKVYECISPEFAVRLDLEVSRARVSLPAEDAV